MIWETEYDDYTARARAADPDTSHCAAASINTSQREQMISDALEKYFPLGANSIELAAKLGWKRDSVSPRIKPMRDKGLLFNTRDKRNGCYVWNLIGRRFA